MKIIGTSSYIKIQDFVGKSMIIEGEMIVNGFVAYKSSMTHWEEPNRHIIVSDEDRERLIKAVVEESKNKGFSIEFE
ncbi:Imm74 family immunity protein [Cohnella panacarvi]|uniref:Imm74 family immunity protein n=1 Tax=Cohnella panacarvi TaxID=400776 RepID=UPI00047D6C8B|nr:Imm74 family immunity protein [Cohnella panacarvi]